MPDRVALSVPERALVSVDEDNKFRFRRTAAASFDLDGKSLANPLLGAAREIPDRTAGVRLPMAQAKSPDALEEIRGELLGIMTAAVRDLDADKLSEESFDSFRTILQIGLETVRDSRGVLADRQPLKM